MAFATVVFPPELTELTLILKVLLMHGNQELTVT